MRGQVGAGNEELSKHVCLQVARRGSGGVQTD